MACRELLPLGTIGLLTAIVFTFLGSHFSVDTPYTSDLVRDPATRFLYTDLAIGTQSFKVNVDTGSSDAWVVSSDFTCIRDGKVVSQADCRLGSLYHADDSFTATRGVILHEGYSPMLATGFTGTAPIKLLSLEATAQVGIVNRLVSGFLNLVHGCSG